MKPGYGWWAAALALGLVGCGGADDTSETTSELTRVKADEGTEGSITPGQAGTFSENEGGENAETVSATGESGDDENTPEEDSTGTVDIRADSNRNGTIDMTDPTEDEGEDEWSVDSGAIFLANVDDDMEQCPQWGTDVNLAKCHDAADEVINGDLDLKDLARMKTAPMPDVEEGTQGTISVSNPGYNYVRLFINDGGEFKLFNFIDQKLTTQQIRDGVELAIEGKDVIRDATAWNGRITLTYGVSDAEGNSLGLDILNMRMSPMMLYHHLLDAEVAYVASMNGASSEIFRSDFQAGIESAGGGTTYFPMMVSDQWSQDYFETGYMSMPAAGGEQHAIRVNFRSANVDNPNSSTNPLRPAGQVVFSYLRGIDSAGIQEYDLSHPGMMDSLDSFGNTETIPPYSFNGESYPLGRIYRGSTPNFYPDQKFTKMLEDQEIQPPVYVDTSWLLVGHVDETISFVPADTELGWKLVMNDAVMAIDMLEELYEMGYGETVMFEGKFWDANASAEVTITQVLNDEDIMAESYSSAAEVDEQVAIIQAATGLTEEDIIRIPYLHWTTSGYSVAYQPGTVNGILIDSKTFMPPKPHGPKVNGKDVMEKQFEEAYATVGMNVHWVEDWDLYHRLLGEVHCGSNATREIPAVKWWETGR